MNTDLTLESVITDPELRSPLTLPSDDLAPGRARAFTRETLAEWSLHAEWNLNQLTDRAQLIVSELVTNARLHGRTRPDGQAEYVTLTLALQDSVVGIEVGDNSPESPIPRASPPSALDGRGLLLVDIAADAWASYPDRDGPGKRVVAILQRPPEPAA
ncbi:ATP-binding protein [Streptomyces sp. NPDC004647]|uniref:ATP-binding protein n=1 Tax=Streptomyces sp. NPDC004647 TaxID=3154671 RepID=UPI0033BF7337